MCAIRCLWTWHGTHVEVRWVCSLVPCKTLELNSGKLSGWNLNVLAHLFTSLVPWVRFLLTLSIYICMYIYERQNVYPLFSYALWKNIYLEKIGEDQKQREQLYAVSPGLSVCNELVQPQTMPLRVFIITPEVRQSLHHLTCIYVLGIHINRN